MNLESRTRALLYDLNVSPLWRDRFDRIFVERIGLPNKGNVLILECGTGGLAVEIADRLQYAGAVVASDADGERLNIARGKAEISNLGNIRFVAGESLESEMKVNFYDLALGDASLLPSERLEPMLRALWKTIAYDGKVVVYAVSRGSFDEFFSVFWEALYNCGLAEELGDKLETLLYSHPTKADLEEAAATAGLRNIQIVICKEEISFANGKEFLESPLIANYWIDGWLDIAPKNRAQDIKDAIVAIIDQDSDGQPFEISVKVAIVAGARGAAAPILISDTEEPEDYISSFDVEEEDEAFEL